MPRTSGHATRLSRASAHTIQAILSISSYHADAHRGGRRSEGVSTADEPPSRQIVRSGGNYYSRRAEQSFGFYRSSFIFMALDRTSFEQAQQSDAERCKAFKRRAAKYFAAAGIDPDRPAPQSPPADG